MCITTAKEIMTKTSKSNGKLANSVCTNRDQLLIWKMFVLLYSMSNRLKLAVRLCTRFWTEAAFLSLGGSLRKSELIQIISNKTCKVFSSATGKFSLGCHRKASCLYDVNLSLMRIWGHLRPFLTWQDFLRTSVICKTSVQSINPAFI